MKKARWFKKMTGIRLDQLPLEVLLLIFENCTVLDLGRLSCTCKYFYEVLSTKKVFWTRKSENVLVTNQMSERFRERCNPLLLSVRDKCIISQHWERKIKYKKSKPKSNALFRGSSRSHIQMTKEMLWWSCANTICGYQRTGNNITPSDLICHKQICPIERGGFNDYPNYFQKFVLCNNEIISTHENDTIKKWVMKQKKKEDGKKTNRLHLRTTYLDEIPCYTYCVDATSQYIISNYSTCIGDCTSGIKMRKNINVSEESVCCEYNTQGPFYEQYRPNALAIDPTGTKLAVGYYGRNVIDIFDINSAHSRLDKISELQPCDFYFKYPRVSNILWEDHHTFLTCNYIYLAKWDLRIGECIRSWNTSQKNYQLHCISSDYQYTIMTGASSATVFAWDQRQDDHVTSYDLYSDGLNINMASEPKYPHRHIVDSLEFDSSRLYATMNEQLYEYNFAEHVKQEIELYQN